MGKAAFNPGFRRIRHKTARMDRATARQIAITGRHRTYGYLPSACTSAFEVGFLQHQGRVRSEMPRHGPLVGTKFVVGRDPQSLMVCRFLWDTVRPCQRSPTSAPACGTVLEVSTP